MGKLFEEDKAIREFVSALLAKRALTDEEREKYIAIEQEISEKSLAYHNLREKNRADTDPDLRIEKDKMQVAKTAIYRYAKDLDGATELTQEADRQIELRIKKPLFKERVFSALVSIKHSLRMARSYIWRRIIIQEGNFVDLKHLFHEEGKDSSEELALLKKEAVILYLISIGLTAMSSPFFYIGLIADKQPIGYLVAAGSALLMGLGVWGGYSKFRSIRNTENKYQEIMSEEQIEALH